eukprot:140620-Alexandrium_andersonii.AAC.1
MATPRRTSRGAPTKIASARHQRSQRRGGHAQSREHNTRRTRARETCKAERAPRRGGAVWF